MHKFRLLLLSLCVFTSVLHAASEDKENKEYNASFFERFTFPNSGNVSQKRSTERRGSVPTFQQALPEKKEQSSFSDIEMLRGELVGLQKKIQDLRRDFVAADIETQRQIGGIHKQVTEDVQKVVGSLSNAVVEVVEKPHDLQPAVNDLTLALKELLGKTATYEEQLQSAATQEEVKQLGEDFAAVVGEINEAVKELPTSDEVKSGMTALVKGLKEYSKKNFVTENKVDAKLVHKAERSDLNHTQECIKKIEKKIPTRSNPQGFARVVDVDGCVHALKKKMATKDDLQSYVTQDALAAQLADKVDRSDLNGYATKDDMQEMKGTIPTVENPQGFATKNDVDERVQALNKQLEDKVDRSDLNGYATKHDMQGFVSKKTHEEAVQEVQTLKQQITALEKNSPKEQAKAGVIYFAKQGALGCFAYQFSPHMASLLRSLKLENSYVDLETVAVPTTTFAVSLLARLAKERYEKGKESSLQNVAKESALDAGVSAGIMGLRYICFDDQMNEYVNQASEQHRTAGYAVSYALLRSLVALFA